jgi:neutral ceramidase
MTWRSLVVFVAALALAGCSAAPTPKAVMLLPIPKQDDKFLAGTAVADITPPLHLALFGHGPEGRVAAGVRLRLRCQVFVLASQGQLLALIPCDLQSPSMSVQRAIATRLAAQGIPISADRIYLMATHTHAGPGHYFEAHHYSGTFSSPIPGYDPDVVNLFADRISNAIAEAFAPPLKPACLGFNVSRLRGVTFNRAYPAFLRNDRSGAPPLSDPQLDLLLRARAADRRAARLTTEEDRKDQDYGFSGPEVAVDDQLTVLRIDAQAADGTCAADRPPLGVLAVYGMHPTGVPNTNDLYHGDIFGFATRTATACLTGAVPKPERADGSTELSLDEAGKNPCAAFDGLSQPSPGNIAPPGAELPVVVGLANGVEGDVSPKLDFQAVTTARRMGRRLGVEIAQAAASITNMSATGTLQHFYRELDFRSGRYGDNTHDKLCASGDLGMSSAGGARDGPTRVRIIPEANPGFRLNEPHGCQTYKMPLRIFNTPSPDDFPTIGPIALVGLQLTKNGRVSDSAWFGTLPLEATTMTGFGIRAALANFGAAGPLVGIDKKLALVGLTNQYFQYVATAPEFDFQFYEGASTLYGPHSAEFLAYQFRCLASEIGGGKPCVDNDNAWPINKVAALTPTPQGRVFRIPPDEEEPPLVLADLDWRRNYRGGALGWEMEFPALPPGFAKDRKLFSMRLLAGRRGQPLQVLDDDRGSAFELHEFVQDNETRWRVRWIPYLGNGVNPICGTLVRLSVDGRYHFESKAFEVDCEAGTPEGGTL